MSDMVNSPKHYQMEGLDIEAKDVIRSVLGEEGYYHFCLGNALKYPLRAGKKDDREQDMAKAEYYAREAQKVAKAIKEKEDGKIVVKKTSDPIFSVRGVTFEAQVTVDDVTFIREFGEETAHLTIKVV